MTVTNQLGSNLPESIVAASDEMRELIGVVRAVAPTQITVLLTGESGTGKEVFARLIHDWSHRSNGPFVTVNCGAIPEGLIESELFGHEKGSFTGATAERKGFFEAAHGGTIFLDEIGEMPLAAQVKLLRVLETGKYTRVGSTNERTTDTRVIAATNRDLELEVRAARFRADLYYRLRAVMLRLPPLRNRRDDIPALSDRMLNDLTLRHSLPHKPHLTSEAIERLTSAEWRGNIRDLRNTLEQLAVMAFARGATSEHGSISAHDVEEVLALHQRYEWNVDAPIHGANLPVRQAQRDAPPASELALIYRALLELRADLAEIKAHVYANGTQASPYKQLPAIPLAVPLADGDLNIERHEQKLITDALTQFGGDRTMAAAALGLSERTLYRKLKEIDESQNNRDQTQ